MKPLLHPVVLNVPPTLRMSGGPRFKNTYIEDGAGNSQCVIEWDSALWQYTLQFTAGSREFGDLTGFFAARQGTHNAWLFEDPFDCSDKDNGGTGLVKTMEDGKRYLVKKYLDVDDFNPYFRLIHCPVMESITFEDVSGSPVVNPYTGEVTGATSDGAATFRFRVPVVFVSDVMEVKRNAGNAPGQWLNVELSEVRRFRLVEGGVGGETRVSGVV